MPRSGSLQSVMRQIGSFKKKEKARFGGMTLRLFFKILESCTDLGKPKKKKCGHVLPGE